MKKLNFFLITSIILLANFLVSCSTKKIGFFNNSYPQYVHKDAPEAYAEASAQANATPVITARPVFIEVGTAEEKNKTGKKVNKSKVTLPAELSKIQAGASENLVMPVKKLGKQERKQIREAVKKQHSNDRSGISTLLLVIIAILLPPLAVALVDGLRAPFWLDLLLTILFYLPGLIYALYRIFRE